MTNALWYCRRCKGVRVGPDHRPPTGQCPSCGYHGDPENGNHYARAP